MRAMEKIPRRRCAAWNATGRGLKLARVARANHNLNDSIDSMFLQCRNRVVTSLAAVKTVRVNGADTLKEYGRPQVSDDRNY